MEDNILEKISEVTNISLTDEAGNYKALYVFLKEVSEWLKNQNG